MASLQFLLNGELRIESAVSPSMTVLDYLRGIARFTGTKEGCAEGDCGACTVAIADAHDEAAHYRAVNSCLMSVAQLDGCSLLTVEGLSRDGALHPVQRALIDADATQCGFCTPGFVMTMFAFAHGGEPADDTTIHEALAGNLCRCTGYRPIVEACRQVAGLPNDAADERHPAAQPHPCEDYRAGDQHWFLPRSLPALTTLRVQHPHAIILGGGTDLGLLLSKERKTLPGVILTSRVSEMKKISAGDGALSLGGAVTYSEALPHLDRHFPAFAALVRRIGSRQIRNLGTFAGNLATASPIGDTTPCLIALGASVALHSDTKSRTLPVEDFITGYRKTALQPDEIIAAIRIPFLPEGDQFAAYKLSKRFDQDISTVVAAFRLRTKDGIVHALRLVYGGMAATTARAHAVEAALTGQPWAASSLAGIGALMTRDFKPMTDQRGSGAYRLDAAANLLRRFQIETTQPAALTRVDAL
ncbi:MAG: xanthine dehydrogenase small subunit [Pseudorhodoplanes sp.]|nr:xanthine dehydrogenase small subunit [Pseudorhodoplanes sp.]